MMTRILIAALCLSELAFAGEIRTLLKENRIEDAAVACRQLESLASWDNDNLVSCAWAYLRSDKQESAAKLMEKLAKNPSLPEFQLLQAYSLLKRKKFPEARAAVTSLSNEHKSGSFAMQVQEVSAEIYEAQGQNDTAAFIYKQMAGDDPTRGRAQWGLGRWYLGKGDIARAKSHLEQTVKMWPKHLGSRYNLAVIALNQENYPEAARWLAECYRLDRADPGVLEQMGLLFEKKGMLDEAVKYWRRALAVSKDSTIAKEKLGQYKSRIIDKLASNKQYGEALEELESDKSTKTIPRARLKKAILYRNVGKFDKAIGELLAYTKANPKDAVGHRELGICYLNTKLVGQAGQSFLRAIELEPKNGLNYAWLGFVLESKGKLKEARDVWKKAIELLTDPAELEKASKRLASVEKRLEKKERQLAEEKEEKKSDEDKDIEKDMDKQDVFEGVEGIPK